MDKVVYLPDPEFVLVRTGEDWHRKLIYFWILYIRILPW